MKRFAKVTGLLMIAGSLVFYSCSNDGSKPASDSAQTSDDKTQSAAAAEGVQFEDVPLTNPLNAQSVAAGKQIYDLKCQSCHKLTDEKLVGPGWKGVTNRRKPGWIIAMVTNPDAMLEKDPEAQKLLEQCLVRMPNQNLSKEEARNVLEFQRSNDGEK